MKKGKHQMEKNSNKYKQNKINGKSNEKMEMKQNKMEKKQTNGKEINKN